MIAYDKYELIKAVKTKPALESGVPTMAFKTLDDTKCIQLDAGENSKTTNISMTLCHV